MIILKQLFQRFLFQQVLYKYRALVHKKMNIRLGLRLCCSGLSYCLPCWHPMWVLLPVLLHFWTSSFLMHLEKQGKIVWERHRRSPWLLGSAWPSSGLRGLLGSEQIAERFLSFCLSLSPCGFQLNKINLNWKKKKANFGLACSHWLWWKEYWLELS